MRDGGVTAHDHDADLAILDTDFIKAFRVLKQELHSSLVVHLQSSSLIIPNTQIHARKKCMFWTNLLLWKEKIDHYFFEVELYDRYNTKTHREFTEDLKITDLPQRSAEWFNWMMNVCDPNSPKPWFKTPFSVECHNPDVDIFPMGIVNGYLLFKKSFSS